MNITPASEKEINELLTESFILAENQAYYDNYRGPDEMLRVNKYAPLELISRIRKMIENILAESGDIAIMDQGCGSGKFLYDYLHRIARKHCPESLEGCGLTAKTQHIFSSLITKEISGNIRTIKTDLKNAGLTIIKEDIHIFMKNTREQFDLILSNATYCHLRHPWLAFARSVNRLKPGGLILINNMIDGYALNGHARDLHGNIIYFPFYAETLSKLNPGYEILPMYFNFAIQKNTDESFRTGLYNAFIHSGGNSILAPINPEGKKLEGFTEIQ